MKNINYINANILDVRHAKLMTNQSLLVRNGRIVEIATTQTAHNHIDEIKDLKGGLIMPGLIDGHVHATAVTADFAKLKNMSPSYVAIGASKKLGDMLDRGFTTVRDAGGCDFGLAQAIEDGLLRGPSILYCGHALSQTGGHGDVRSVGENETGFCFCCAGLGLVCDGISEVRKATRNEIRKGANQIKIMASGGVSSPTDRIDSTQFSEEEIKAIVEEAKAANIYVMAHAYTAKAINRCLALGIRTIEHGNLLDDESISLFQKTGAFLVPTLATYHALAKEGVKHGLPKELENKIFQVLDAGTEALKKAYQAKIPMVYGSDLLGEMQRHQLTEFTIRSKVVDNKNLVRAATCNAADAFNQTGEIGELVPGAKADFLLLDSNPLDDISVLTNPKERLKLVVKGGNIVLNQFD